VENNELRRLGPTVCYRTSWILIPVGQYGPTCPGNPGIDGNYGNVYCVTYEAAKCGSASTPTSRPMKTAIRPPLTASVSVATETKHPMRRGDIFIGCSGWAYPSWKPEFYPPSVPAKKFLEYYATRLNSVEVNYTFRSLPSEATVQSWLAATGDDFRFSFKAPQRITHILRLKNCREALDKFANSIASVAKAGRLGVILFQLPPNMKADPERLASFLTDAQQIGFRITFEFRHESWFADSTYALLREHSAALCIAESDELSTPGEITAPFTTYRLRKKDYSTADLAAIRETLKARAAHGDVFAYFKHEDEPTGALRAVSILEGVREA
jgi:uncharacterized protein YecE (DUF72 family)